MSRLRNWCFTLNNYTPAELDSIKSIDCRYLVVGEEIAPNTGTPHLQGYVEFEKAMRLSAAKSVLGDRVHLEARNGTPQQASDYCKKEGKFFEKGTMQSPGTRTDLCALKEEIMKGKSVKDIRQENPNIYHQYGRTLEAIEADRLADSYRTWMTEGIWLTGPSGCGKSHLAFEGFSPKTHYVYKNDKGWWDGYCGQEIVIFNDYRGEIPYNQLLQLLDKYPVEVRRRNKAPMPFLAKKIIFTSVLKPDEVYHNTNARETIDQLMRRIKVVNMAPGTVVQR